MPTRRVNNALSTRSISSGLSTDNGPNGLMKAALGFTEITLDIPEKATLKEVEQSLELAITGYKRLNEASERLKPIIGRILLTVQQRNLFKPDYRNFTQFLMDRVVVGMGLGRSNAFDALRIARAFPNMSQEEYMRYGASRLLLTAQITDESQENYKDLLKESTSLTVEELRNKIKENRPQGGSYTISIRVSPEVKAEWMELTAEVTETPGELFAELLAFSKDKIRSKKRKAMQKAS